MSDQEIIGDVDIASVIESVLLALPDSINREALIHLFITIIFAYGMEDEREEFIHAFAYSLMNTHEVKTDLH